MSIHSKKTGPKHKPNRYIQTELHTIIILQRKIGGNMQTLIDNKDIQAAQAPQVRWYVAWNKRTQSYYVLGAKSRSIGGGTIRLHGIIMNCPKGMTVDHINHDTLDNRRYNLRVVTQSTNSLNRKGAEQGSASGLRGVYFCPERPKKKWRAMVQGKTIRYFTTKEEAADAVYKRLKELNVPNI